MTSHQSPTAHAPALWEKVTVTAVSIAIFVLLGYLIVRNEPFRSPNLVVAMRILIAVAAATLGGTIPGFLNVGWNVRGVSIRAGGALALFVIAFFGTPTVLPETGSTQVSG